MSAIRPAARLVPSLTVGHLVVALVAVAVASVASAGTVYRCGNTFQDQPCVDAKAAMRPADRSSATDDAATVKAARPASPATRPAVDRLVLDPPARPLIEARR